MKIEETAVNLAATHAASSSQSVSIAAEYSFGQLFESLATAPAEASTNLQQRVQKLLESLLKTILAAIDGRQCQEPLAADAASLPVGNAASGGERGIAWRRVVSERISESESTEVCARGSVRTCDGRSIDFDFSLTMQREYSRERVSEESGSIRLRDPLVLSFAGNYCELVGERFDFDLDADGSCESLPGLAGGSAFLVFDRNGNGRADDGSELFGARSGDGFADLARLDDDGNGWIDEADAAYARLALWSGDSYRPLAAAGVGALYTLTVDAPFALKTADNELLGQIRSAGVYLMESGQAGLLQQVDLAVSGRPAGQQEPGEGQGLRT